MPFMDYLLVHFAGKGQYFFLYGYLGYNQIYIAPKYQDKTIFTCLYGIFAFKRMAFGLWNALTIFQHYPMFMFFNMMEDTIEVFINNFLLWVTHLVIVFVRRQCCEEIRGM